MQDFLIKFGINWKLLLAQGVNFFILFLILAKFVYRPVLELLRKRREDIERGIAMTHEAETRLAQTQSQEQQILSQAHQQSLSIIQAGEQRGKTRETEIIGEAQRKSAVLLTEAEQRIIKEHKAMQADFYHEAHDLIRRALSKILVKDDLTQIEDQLIQTTVKELETT